PMTWLDNDWPVIGIAQPGNDYGEPVTEYKKPDIYGTFIPCTPADSDSFSSKELGLQWQFNANPCKDWYSFNDRGIQLNAVYNQDGDAVSDLSNLLLQKWPAPEFHCITEIDYGNLKNGNLAGLVSMGMAYAALVVEKIDHKYRLVIYSGRQTFNGTEWSTIEEKNIIDNVILTGEKVRFRYQVVKDGFRDLNTKEKHFPLEKITLSYSVNNNDFVPAITFDSEPGRWVGTKMGIFASSTVSDCGSATFLYFDVIPS
ncbi:MAG: glycoside hydrolase, partial [Lachnospiraceae bacterium]